MYYFKLIKDGKITSVEAKSVNITSSDFVKATKSEYNSFMASLPVSELKPPLVFEPPGGTGLPEKIAYIEEFLSKLYSGKG